MNLCVINTIYWLTKVRPGGGEPSELLDQWPDSVFKEPHTSLLFFCSASPSLFFPRTGLFMALGWLPATVQLTSCLLIHWEGKWLPGILFRTNRSFPKASGWSFIMFFFVWFIFGPELGHMLIPVTFSTVRCELRMPQILLRPVVCTIHTSLKLVFSWEGGRGNGCWVATKSVLYTFLAVLRPMFLEN